jgi:DASH complex subunit DAD2
MAPQQAVVLAARIESKKAELDNLRQLRDLSNSLAERMQALEDRIGTLKEGTEGLPSFGP